MITLLSVTGLWAFMRWGNPVLQSNPKVPALAKTALRVVFGGGGPGAVEK